jgi:disulfide bond formation protein DsbB
MMIARLRVALFLSALVSAMALAIALGSENWAGLVPCALCLLERWPYRVVIAVGLAGLLLPRGWAWLALAICIISFAAAAAAGFVHVGVEQGWWPSPLPQCMAPNFSGMTMAQRLAAMPATPSKPCEDPTYLISALPISMAMMNMLAALALTLGLSIFALRNMRSAP